MRDPFQSNQKRRRRLRLIEVDAWIDSSLFRAGRALANAGEAVSLFMRRFRVTGWKRGLVEVAGDGLTLGTGGALVMLMLAIPAWEVTRSDWRSRGEIAVTFLDRYGNEIGKRGINQSDAVALDDMPDHLIKAVLATEDRRFFSHMGIDFLGTFRALGENLRANSVVQGGSSLSQQLAKNLFLSNERTIERKIKEAFLAMWLEANLPKTEILKLYLDRAYMGGGAFGVEAASEFYYGKSVKDVSLAEAALLAGLFKAPSRYAPHINLPAARARANQVLSNMVESGFLTEGQVIGARRRPADIIVREALPGSPDYFMDWAFERVKEIAPGFRGERVLVVRSTLDMGMQRAAEESILTNLRQFGDSYRVKQAAMVGMDVDGSVRAMVGGRDYGESQFNRAVSALRQPGSSFKVYVYTAAMMNGFTPKSVVRDAPICIGNWCPKNYSGGYSGAVNLTTALVKSINTIPVRLAQAFGRDKIVEVGQAMGLTHPLLITRSLPLGASEVTVLDQAAAYSVLANGGFKATPYAFTQVMNAQGDVLYDRRRDAPPAERVLPPEVVADMNGILVQVPEWGTGRRAKLDGIRVAGKTGTTSAYRDAWFVGYTGNYTAAVWFGNDNYAPMRRLTGGVLPAQAFNQFMTYAHQGVQLAAIPYIDNPFEGAAASAQAVAEGEQVEGAAGRATTLSDSTSERLTIIEQLLRKAAGIEPLAALVPPGDQTPAITADN